jgi:homoserine/homoserine lactone efflux protein
MSLEAWMIFCVTETLLCLTPGPAVLLVVSLGMARGARAGTRAGVGILTANALYFALSATGVGALLLASWKIFFAVKWIGAAYLVWIGLGMLWRRGASNPETESPAPRGAGFRHGFLTQAANPKSLLFFGAILPQFLDPAVSLAPQILVLGASSIAIELLVLCAYAQLAARGGRSLRSERARAFLEPAGGAMLLAAAAQLARLRRGNDAPAALLP